MKSNNKWFERALILALPLLLIALLRFTPLWPDEKGGIFCENTPDAESGTLAPGGKLQAIGFGRSCGFAINDLWPNVSILSVGEKLTNSRGNVFSCGDTAYTYDDIHEFGVHWADDKHLVIYTTTYCVENADRKLTSFEGVEIAYKSAPEKTKAAKAHATTPN